MNWVAGSYLTSGLRRLDVFGLDGVPTGRTPRVRGDLYSASECPLTGSRPVACPATARRPPRGTSSQRDGTDRAEALRQGTGVRVGDDQTSKIEGRPGVEVIVNSLARTDFGASRKRDGVRARQCRSSACVPELMSSYYW